MRKITYGEGIREALREKMLENKDVVLLGEDVGPYGGTFGVTKGLWEQFGEERVRDTPISEGVIVGASVGAAATGLRPVAELMFIDFLTFGMDGLVNQAAKMRYMFGGKISVPLVLRLPAGGGISAGAQHSGSLEAWVTHVPGLKVVYPSNAADAWGLMLTAIDDDNPVVYIESKVLYSQKSEVPDKVSKVPFGSAAIAREGADVSIITYGKQVHDALKAAAALAKDGIEAEVIDLRSLYPLDKETIFRSVAKTHRALVVTEEVKRGGYGGELSALVSEQCFDELDAPVVRIGALDSPVPYSQVLESLVLPSVEDIVKGVKEMF
ncbi:pyruvate dehydrogenase E1 component beta subunit [Paenibacillus sophorae]|uniref:Alpha-ketoacid dehydrogenase subunit beta n=1 Tax=Paenibacillus sophorae TaxID=1333845 RepID=A0A1H8UU69_9BACL|nr:alpha-ketoacid dehydrogenase subunit beta [Paenibacillus sophorae]QWU15374.1 alpha-ketoacid dehydrogenase subunit beta [Paenibacillus sophorae]SEP06474.1 pyruvate dehydrogenase E1 component beta subunit [Paenibacillus sophorae]